jgi:hypothetical protein
MLLGMNQLRYYSDRPSSAGLEERLLVLLSGLALILATGMGIAGVTA